MEIVAIGVSALLLSGLTLFSGFGLGPVLMPVSALFFPLPLAIAATAVVHFAFLALSARFQALAFPPRWLPSGSFGGLSGKQGALRSAFLLKSGLSKEAFIATGVDSAVIVDAARLAVYGLSFMASNFAQSQELRAPLAVGTVCAFIGSFMGNACFKT